MRIAADRIIAHERQWDPFTGGPESRPFRELLAYCAQRLVDQGATVDTVVSYLRNTFEEFGLPQELAPDPEHEA